MRRRRMKGKEQKGKENHQIPGSLISNPCIIHVSCPGNGLCVDFFMSYSHVRVFKCATLHAYMCECVFISFMADSVCTPVSPESRPPSRSFSLKPHHYFLLGFYLIPPSITPPKKCKTEVCVFCCEQRLQYELQVLHTWYVSTRSLRQALVNTFIICRTKFLNQEKIVQISC